MGDNKFFKHEIIKYREYKIETLYNFCKAKYEGHYPTIQCFIEYAVLDNNFKTANTIIDCILNTVSTDVELNFEYNKWALEKNEPFIKANTPPKIDTLDFKKKLTKMLEYISKHDAVINFKGDRYRLEENDSEEKETITYIDEYFNDLQTEEVILPCWRIVKLGDDRLDRLKIPSGDSLLRV